MQKKVVEFLQGKLQERYSYKLSPKDKRKLNQNPEDFIVDRITSKKFKKRAIDDSTLENIRRKVTKAIASKQPIKFTFPFGGYKLHSLQSAPRVDWAEFFTVAYYADFLNQIAEHYEPGAQLTFSSDEVIISRLNNLSQEDLDQYTNSFERLLKLFEEYLPNNLKISLQTVRDLYHQEDELEKELQERMKDTKVNWESAQPARKDFIKKSFLLNYRFDKKVDEPEVEELLKMNLQIHDAYLQLSKRKAFVRGEDVIVLFTNQIPDAVTLGTTRFSAVKFWTGFGALRLKDEALQDHVFSPKQLESAGDYELIKVSDIMSLENENFDTIRLYK